jgi:subtilisin-like proprotein convertase family protein
MRGRLVTCAALAAGLLLPGVAGAKVFSSGDVDKRIPKVGLAMTKIKVNQPGKVTDIDVEVRITHSYTPDLVVGLLGPNKGSQFQELALHESGSGTSNETDFGTGAKSCKGTNTRFDDEAGTELENGDNPFVGSFRPEFSLSTFDDERARGTWRLYVFDLNQGDGGSLHGAKLDIAT